MADGTVTLQIRLTSDGRGARAEIGAVTGDLNRVGGAAAGAGAAARTAGGELLAFAQVAAAAFAVAQVARYAGEIAKLTVQYQALGLGMAAALDSNSAGASGMAYTSDQASRLGLRLRDTSQQFLSFSASTRNSRIEGVATKAVFEAVGEAATALGLNAETTGRAFIALAQMASKGTVMAEELKGQLSEALPGTFNLAAQALGVTTAKLQQMLEAGGVLAEDLLPKLAARLHQQYGPAAAAAAHHAGQEWNRFVNAVEAGEVAFGGGWLEEAASVVRDLTGYLKDPGVVSALRDWGTELGGIIRLIHDNAGDLLRYGTGAAGAYTGAQFGAGFGSAFGPAGTVIGGIGGGITGAVGGYQAADRALGISTSTRLDELETRLAALQTKGPKSSGLFGVTELDRADQRAQVRALEEQIATLKEGTISWRENEDEVRRHSNALEGWRQIVLGARRDIDSLDITIDKATSGLATAARAQYDYQQKAAVLNKAFRAALEEAAGAGDLDRYRKLWADYSAANADLTAKLGDATKTAYARADRLNSLAIEGDLGGARARYQAELSGIEAREKALEATFSGRADAARQRWLSLAADVEQRYALPAGLLGATMQVESRFDPAARSRAGAVGLMQFMPATARGLGVDATSPEQSIAGAGRYYRQLLDQTGGDLTSAIAAYNWGPGNLSQQGLGAAPEETRNHVQRVLAALPKYRDANSQLLGVDRDYNAERARLLDERQGAETQWIDTQIAALTRQREDRRANGALTAADEAEVDNRIDDLQAQRVATERQTAAQITEQYRAAALARAQVLGGLRDDLDRLRAEALTTDAGRQDALLALEQQRRRRQVLAEAQGNADTLTAAREMLDQIEQLERDSAERRKHPLRELASDWADSARAMEQASAGWAQNSAAAIAQFAVTGKAEFERLAQSIIQDIIRIQIQQAAAPALQWLSGALGGLFGGSAANAGDFNISSLAGPVLSASVHHTGGAAGTGLSRQVPALVFAGARRFHGGGVAGLAPDEVPAILQRGERVVPKGQAGTASVAVNNVVHNYAGAEVKQRTSRGADGSITIETIVDSVESVQRRRLRAGGGLSPDIADVYGLNRGSVAAR